MLSTQLTIEFSKNGDTISWRLLSAFNYMATWFRAYGCLCVEVATTVDKNAIGERVWVSIGTKVPEDANVDRLIVIQTEHATAPGWVDNIRGLLGRCQSSPSCVIWDFSESNVRIAKTRYNLTLPTVILPITTSRSSIPKSLVPINSRDFGYIFVSFINEGREAIAKILDNEMHLRRWVDGGTAEGFSRSKLCLSVHFYQEVSGLELDRLAQHVYHGCMPLYENVGDRVAEKYLTQQGVIRFAMYGTITQTAADIISCISEEPEEMIKQQNFVHRWWSYELETFDKVLRAFFP